jgi:hypothetical protein
VVDDDAAVGQRICPTADVRRVGCVLLLELMGHVVT